MRQQTAARDPNNDPNNSRAVSNSLSCLPAVERVIPGYHVTAAGTNQKADAVVKALWCGRRGWTLALASDGSGVRRAATVGLTLAGDLSAAVWVHAVDEPIWKTGVGGAHLRQRGEALMTWMHQETCEHLHYGVELWCTRMTCNVNLSSLKRQQRSRADMKVWTISKCVTYCNMNLKSSELGSSLLEIQLQSINLRLDCSL